MRFLIIASILSLPFFASAQVWTKGEGEIRVSNKLNLCADGAVSVYDSLGVFITKRLFLEENTEMKISVNQGVYYVEVDCVSPSSGEARKYRSKVIVEAKKD